MEKTNNDIVEHWVSLLHFKNYLATLSLDELYAFASDFNSFYTFLSDSKSLVLEEPAFLLLNDEFLTKISDVVSDYRFQYSDEILFNFSNEVIADINLLLCMSSYNKQIKISNYLLFQEEYRKRKIRSIDLLIEVNANDSIVFTGIEDGIQYLPTEDVLSSLNYFTYICPECFYDDEFYLKTLSYLNSCCDVPFYKKASKDYQYALDIKSTLKKVKKN